MWVCLNDGFLSLVEHKTDENVLVVRARRREILEELFPTLELIETQDADYAFRVFCTRNEVKEMLCKRVDEIDYPNFKNSVKENDLHSMYAQMWWVHAKYQHVNNDIYQPKWYDIYR